MDEHAGKMVIGCWSGGMCLCLCVCVCGVCVVWCVCVLCVCVCCVRVCVCFTVVHVWPEKKVDGRLGEDGLGRV